MTGTGAKEMTVYETLAVHRGEILALAARHGATNVRVFGSVARREADAESDVDLLVDLLPGRGLLDLGALLMDLRELLGLQVDVVTPAGMHERMRGRALAGAVPLERVA
jgi:predicted nucleotidyltransferase